MSPARTSQTRSSCHDKPGAAEDEEDLLGALCECGGVDSLPGSMRMRLTPIVFEPAASPSRCQRSGHRRPSRDGRRRRRPSARSHGDVSACSSAALQRSTASTARSGSSLEPHPRLRLADELAQLGEQRRGGSASSRSSASIRLEPLDHRTCLVHAPTRYAAIVCQLAARSAKYPAGGGASPRSDSSSDREQPRAVAVHDDLDERATDEIGRRRAGLQQLEQPAALLRRLAEQDRRAQRRRPRAVAVPEEKASDSRSCSPRNGSAWKSESSQRSSASPSCLVLVGREQPAAQSAASRPRNSSSRVGSPSGCGRGDRQHGPDAVRPPVEPLEQHRPGGDRPRGRRAGARSRRRRARRARRAAPARPCAGCARARARASRSVSRPKSGGSSPAPRASAPRARRSRRCARGGRRRGRSPCRRRCRRAARRRRTHVPSRRASARAPRTRGRTRASSQSKPPQPSAVETSSGSDDRAEERVVFVRARPRVRAREDPRRRLARRSSSARRASSRFAKLGRARLEEPAHERPVLVERRTAERFVLLERERQVLVDEQAERGEREAAQGAVEVRSAHGHRVRYFAAGPSPLWQPGHQYAMRAASPSGHERTVSPQRGHGRPLRL